MSEGLLGFISGLITDSHSAIPIKEVAVTITGISGTSYSTTEGLYLVGPLPSGTYTINFTKNGYTTKIVTGVNVDGINETFVDAKLVPEEATIKGKVYITNNAQKTIVTGRIVALTQKGDIVKTVTSDSSGMFTFSNLLTGIYRVAARIRVPTSQTFYDKSKAIILMGGQTRAGINLNLTLLQSLSGREPEDVAIEQSLGRLAGS